MHMIGISGRCATEPSSSSGLYLFPFERPRTSRVHVRLRAQNGMPMVQSPRSSEARFTMRWAYLILVSDLPLDFVDSGLEPTDFSPSVFPLFSGRTEVDNLVHDDGPDDEHDHDPAADEDRDERPKGSAPHARNDDDHRYSDGDSGKDRK